MEEKYYLFQHTQQSLVCVLIKRVEVVSYSATEQNWVLHIHTQQYPISSTLLNTITINTPTLTLTLFTYKQTCMFSLHPYIQYIPGE